jgi:predicted acylesterase/phospholipase RssA
MKLGLCLTGGGAKGAFQGGVIKGLYENNILPEILTGTSIGAVNSYFMIKGCFEELEFF